MTTSIGAGPERTYHAHNSPNFGYPLRVPPGSVADMDVIMDHCDFSENRVRMLHALTSEIILTSIAVRQRLLGSTAYRCRIGWR